MASYLGNGEMGVIGKRCCFPGPGRTPQSGSQARMDRDFLCMQLF